LEGGDTVIYRFAVVVFSLAGLAGPLIRYLTWPPSDFELAVGTRWAQFVYYLVFFLWPTQPFGIAEYNIGRLIAIAYVVGANVVLFGAVGLVVGMAARWRKGVLFVYGGVCALVVFHAVSGAGSRLAHEAGMPLLTALVLYTIPFWLVTYKAARRVPGMYEHP
jgi:hypothetical protein